MYEIYEYGPALELSTKWKKYYSKKRDSYLLGKSIYKWAERHQDNFTDEDFEELKSLLRARVQRDRELRKIGFRYEEYSG
jgi:ABC-type ATPase with predicted acetyltransferase domain